MGILTSDDNATLEEEEDDDDEDNDNGDDDEEEATGEEVLDVLALSAFFAKSLGGSMDCATIPDVCCGLTA